MIDQHQKINPGPKPLASGGQRQIPFAYPLVPRRRSLLTGLEEFQHAQCPFMDVNIGPAPTFSMAEVAMASKYHRKPGFIGGRNDFVIA